MNKYLYVCPGCRGTIIVLAEAGARLPFLTRCRATKGCRIKMQQAMALGEQQARADFIMTPEGIRGVV